MDQREAYINDHKEQELRNGLRQYGLRPVRFDEYAKTRAWSAPYGNERRVFYHVWEYEGDPPEKLEGQPTTWVPRDTIDEFIAALSKKS